MGQRGTKTCDVILESVRVPAANIIGGVPGQGFKTAMKVLDRGRLHASALACGLTSRILEKSARYASERKQFGSRSASSSWSRPCWPTARLSCCAKPDITPKKNHHNEN